MCDVHEAGGHDALQEVGLLQAALDPDPGLEHEGPELPQAHVGEFLRIVRRRLGLDHLNLFSINGGLRVKNKMLTQTHTHTHKQRGLRQISAVE